MAISNDNETFKFAGDKIKEQFPTVESFLNSKKM